MTDAVILVILVIALIFGVKGTVKHFKGEGACCGGGSGTVKAKRKSLKNPKLGEKTIQIEGMHCDHCLAAVEAALDGIGGVWARASLPDRVRVLSKDPIDPVALAAAVESAGYRVAR